MYDSSVYRRYPVLFVDDEEKALKYFRLAFGKSFEIIIASSVAEAKAILEARGEDIGVLITDQRMPEQTGVELLKYVRARFPTVVRILTTAYSDLDDAIDAVNSGEIYRYVTKPWDINDLRAELGRAMELHVLRRERDLLLAEKLSVRQRKLAVDRARDLLMFASTLTWMRNALPAVWDYIRHGFADAPQQAPDAREAGAGLAHWEPVESEILRSQAVLRTASAELAAASADPGFNDSLRPAELLSDGLGAARDRADVDLDAAVDAGGSLQCNGMLIKRLFELLVGVLLPQEQGTAAKLRFSAQEAAAQTAIVVEATSANSRESLIRTGDAATLGVILSVYLIAGHHGGRVEFEQPAEAVSRFTVVLPVNAEKSEARTLPDEWLEDVFSRYEGWLG